MKKLLGETLISKTKNIITKYYIIKSDNGAYGLQIRQIGGIDNGNISTIMNITKNYSIIKELGNLILRNKVLPISLNDVIEDFLCDREI